MASLIVYKYIDFNASNLNGFLLLKLNLFFQQYREITNYLVIKNPD